MTSSKRIHPFLGGPGKTPRNLLGKTPYEKDRNTLDTRRRVKETNIGVAKALLTPKGD